MVLGFILCSSIYITKIYWYARHWAWQVGSEMVVAQFLPQGIHSTMMPEGPSWSSALCLCSGESFTCQRLYPFTERASGSPPRAGPDWPIILSSSRLCALTVGHTIHDLTAAMLTQTLIFLKWFRNTSEILSGKLGWWSTVMSWQHAFFFSQREFHLSSLLPTQTCSAWGW